MNGDVGVAFVRSVEQGQSQLYLQLQPGESVILRAFTDRTVQGPPWKYFRAASPATSLFGQWRVEFLAGGPTLPATFSTRRLSSWTDLGGTEAQNFAGTASYSLSFDAPDSAQREWDLSLGRVCQSARVRLNGRELGTLIIPPFRVTLKGLKRSGNKLEVEVTNVSANAIRYYDRRGVKWKNFSDINFVNLNYRPFDASNWPLTESGLMGPVTLTAIQPLNPLEAGQ
jgi:hypothetical protein